MDISLYIGNILKSSQDLALPNFGIIYKARLYGYFDEAEKKLYPPRTILKFRKYPNNDSVLVKYLADAQNLNQSSAEYFVNQYVENIIKNLEQVGNYNINKVGVFKLQNEIISFESSYTSIYDHEFFGLPYLHIGDVEEEASSNVLDNFKLEDLPIIVEEPEIIPPTPAPYIPEPIVVAEPQLEPEPEPQPIIEAKNPIIPIPEPIILEDTHILASSISPEAIETPITHLQEEEEEEEEDNDDYEEPKKRKRWIILISFIIIMSSTSTVSIKYFGWNRIYNELNLVVFSDLKDTVLEIFALINKPQELESKSILHNNKIDSNAVAISTSTTTQKEFTSSTETHNVTKVLNKVYVPSTTIKKQNSPTTSLSEIHKEEQIISPSVSIKINKKEETKTIPINTEKPSSLQKIATTIQEKTNNVIDNLQKTILNNEVTPTPLVEKPATLTETKPTISAKTPKNQPVNVRYDIISQSFSKKADAQQHLKGLTFRTSKARVILDTVKNLYRVSLGSFRDRDAAQKELDAIPEEYTSNLWIMEVRTYGKKK